ncbi:hypothetical protein NDU88_012560 [Pleurodeles waltl]|uniref:Uncharacterized protein n=1 Tax=Pleurodeles waltl TaxID=8319 RepID=A0AAV7R3L4_PLEWA|nr:hypothetical protein NDU88_012560 [Pleurodeles waltl]
MRIEPPTTASFNLPSLLSRPPPPPPDTDGAEGWTGARSRAALYGCALVVEPGSRQNTVKQRPLQQRRPDSEPCMRQNTYVRKL